MKNYKSKFLPVRFSSFLYFETHHNFSNFFLLIRYLTPRFRSVLKGTRTLLEQFSTFTVLSSEVPLLVNFVQKFKISD